MNAEDLKLVVKEKYGEIVTQKEDLCHLKNV